ncbi:MAG TPA: lysoplasmalogenase [Polyangia bacterium]|nr:lysoplasmalogenase [Polyangia bacterium]
MGASLGSTVSSASLGIALVAIFGALAIFGSETKRHWLMALAKPIATACLLLVVGPPPTGDVEKLIAFGIVFSILGDALLVNQSDRAFFAGTAAFLTAQLLYAAAFWTLRSPEHPISPAALVVVLVSAALVASLWKPAGALRPAIVVYAVAITLMVSTALGTIGGPLAPPAAILAAVGAVLFYISDATLAWNKFRRPLPYAAVVTMGVYWIGQIGIALAIRLASA